MCPRKSDRTDFFLFLFFFFFLSCVSEHTTTPFATCPWTTTTTRSFNLKSRPHSSKRLQTPCAHDLCVSFLFSTDKFPGANFDNRQALRTKTHCEITHTSNPNDGVGDGMSDAPAAAAGGSGGGSDLPLSGWCSRGEFAFLKICCVRVCAPFIVRKATVRNCRIDSRFSRLVCMCVYVWMFVCCGTVDCLIGCWYVGGFANLCFNCWASLCRMMCCWCRNLMCCCLLAMNNGLLLLLFVVCCCLLLLLPHIFFCDAELLLLFVHSQLDVIVVHCFSSAWRLLLCSLVCGSS